MNWSAIGSTLGGLGSLYGAYSQQKMGKELLALQKSFANDEKKRKKKSQARLDYAADTAFHRDDNARLPAY